MQEIALRGKGVAPPPYDPLRASHRASCEQYARIVKLVNAMRGDAYGACVRENLILLDGSSSSTGPPRLLSRPALPPITAMFYDARGRSAFEAALRVDYEVHVSDVSAGSQTLTVRLIASCDPDRLVVISRCEDRGAWRSERPALDVDVLASNHRALYTYPEMLRLPVHAVLARIFRRRFSLMDGSKVSAGAAMREAASLVARGWTMEPKEEGRGASWIAQRWSRRDGSPHTDPPTCVMCLDTIAAEDVVVRLSCGHVFHAFCGGGVDGACRWFDESSICPCCRSHVSEEEQNPVTN